MAENELIIEISAKTVELVQGLAEGTEALKEFGKDGVYSIEQLNAALKLLKKAAEKSLDVKEVEEFGKSFGEVRNKVNQAKDVFNGAADNLDKVTDSSKRARVAVYGLNQVVRDAPFGFIAISNNLPILFDEFSKLRQETGGTGAALKAFGASLLGPAGISIGISVVIGLITTAVQKYGSLSNAVKALTSTNGDLIIKLEKSSKALQEFFDKANDVNQIQRIGAGTATEEANKISDLLTVLKQENLTREQKVIALGKIKEANSKLFGDYDLEKATIAELIGLYERYNTLLISQETAKVFATSIADVNKQLFDQQKLLDDTTTRRKAAEKEAANAFDKYLAYISQTNAREAQSEILLAKKNRAQNELNQLKSQESQIQNNINKLNSLNTKYRQGQLQFTIQEIQNQAELQKYLDTTFKKIQSKGALQKEEKATRDSIIAGYKQDIIALENILEKTSKLSQDYTDIQAKILLLKSAIEKLKTPSAAVKIDFNTQQEITDLENALKSRQFEAGRVRFNIKDSIDEATKEINKELPKKISKFETKNINLNINPEFEKNVTLARLRIEELDKRLRSVKEVIASSTFNVASKFLDGLVNGFQEGTNAVDAFKNALLELGKTIVVEIAKIALLQAIKVGLDAALPGLGSGASLLAGATFASRPSGGTSLSVPGGIALSGNVVFVQRGPDLVGVLNQGNARINRVG